ncbi:hypothetical protein [Agrobacterium pusense]|uniref:hypothetical protein n=1 Tax=Agrobacterium pusense TaxID=648995 RepID=UPI001571F8B5|nr:hypothetical protein [Agrobacterium pusense]
MNRSPNGINVHRFLEGYGVKVLPYHLKRDPRPANVVYGGREVARLMRKDIDRTGITVRCIQASNPVCFDDIYLWSIWRFLSVHFPQSEARAAIGAFPEVTDPETNFANSGGAGTSHLLVLTHLSADTVARKELKKRRRDGKSPEFSPVVGEEVLYLESGIPLFCLFEHFLIFLAAEEEEHISVEWRTLPVEPSFHYSSTSNPVVIANPNKILRIEPALVLSWKKYPLQLYRPVRAFYPNAANVHAPAVPVYHSDNATSRKGTRFTGLFRLVNLDRWLTIAEYEGCLFALCVQLTKDEVRANSSCYKSSPPGGGRQPFPEAMLLRLRPRQPSWLGCLAHIPLLPVPKKITEVHAKHAVSEVPAKSEAAVLINIVLHHAPNAKERTVIS